MVESIHYLLLGLQLDNSIVVCNEYSMNEETKLHEAIQKKKALKALLSTR